MKIFNCILGVFSLFAAFYCFMYPGVSFVTNAGWLVTMALCVFGLCSIFEYSRKKKNNEYIVNGVMGLVFGIGAAVISFLMMFNILARTVAEIFILVLFGIWLVYIGVETIAKSIKAKKDKSKTWWLTLLFGILAIIMGIYTGTHLIFAMMSLGFLMGFAFTVYGVNLIGTIFETEE